jgi:hypothetical protein
MVLAVHRNRSHQRFPLPPIDVSDACVLVHVCADPPRSDERVPLLCCSRFLEMKGSAQDVLKDCLSPRRSD